MSGNRLSGANRLCYVIMPFSATATCTEDEWTEIFDHLIKPAVEKAGLGYECRRSEATRGNIIKAIVQSLHEAHLVVADMTDQNPNVFYELGVRHALANRTILLAQELRFIPFDLQPYAVCEYNWRTEQGQKEFTARMRELLAGVDSEPDRADNPVSDFLGQPAARRSPSRTVRVPVHRIAGRPALVGSGSQKTDASALGLDLAQSDNKRQLRLVIRDAQKHFDATWPRRLIDMNAAQPGERQLKKDETYDYAVPITRAFSQDVPNVESLGLAFVEAEWRFGMEQVLVLGQDWITYSENRIGTVYKAVQGSPALCAFRLLSLLGTKATANGSFDLVSTLLREPLESKTLGGQRDLRPFGERVELFYPEGLLGRADLGVRYLAQLYEWNQHVKNVFRSEQEYWDNLARFLLVACLAVFAAVPKRSWPLYPGYAGIPGHTNCLESFVERMRRQPDYLTRVAGAVGETADAFRSAWPERAAALNADSHKVNWASDFSLPEKL